MSVKTVNGAWSTAFEPDETDRETRGNPGRNSSASGESSSASGGGEQSTDLIPWWATFVPVLAAGQVVEESVQYATGTDQFAKAQNTAQGVGNTITQVGDNAEGIAKAGARSIGWLAIAGIVGVIAWLAWPFLRASAEAAASLVE